MALNASFLLKSGPCLTRALVPTVSWRDCEKQMKNCSRSNVHGSLIVCYYVAACMILHLRIRMNAMLWLARTPVLVGTRAAMAGVRMMRLFGISDELEPASPRAAQFCSPNVLILTAFDAAYSAPSN